MAIRGFVFSGLLLEGIRVVLCALRFTGLEDSR